MQNRSGLTMNEVKKRQLYYGKNVIQKKKKTNVMKYLIHIMKEPIYVLLTCSALIYFLLGEQTDGLIMIAFVIFVIGIDIFQDARTGNALKKLKEFTTPRIRVIREGKEATISSEELVPGDLLLLSEGIRIPADCSLISSEGLCVDESILTGETAGIWKSSGEICYTGTFVLLGNGTALIEKIGDDTVYGMIAEKIAEAPMEVSLLQKQMKILAKQCTYFAGVLFILVSVITYFNLSDYAVQDRFIQSLLAGVVLALSMIPGEFPVILSVFLSMGALRLSKHHALVRRLSSVETLGAVSVICLDKTGTITQNRMKVEKCVQSDRTEGKFCHVVSLSCKQGTLDPVEKALMEYGNQLCEECKSHANELIACDLSHKKRELVKEYAFTNELKAMGQVWQEKEMFTLAAKGSPETILSLCYLNDERETGIRERLEILSKEGLRVIAVADAVYSEDSQIPGCLTDCSLNFRGLIGFSDPPREFMRDHIKACYEAGIRVMMITGDHPVTAASIAEKIGMINCNLILTGEEIAGLSEEELRSKVMEYNIFARVLPIHKLRIVKALKENGEIVAMTGDGVNDSPALKSADIGIAMGKHGSEICREAADLILLDDDFTTILKTVRDGRRIYQNIVKTIGYIFAIHIPIALISLAAPLLNITPEALFLLPLHIVLMELVMDPTCSITLERQPCEDNVMKQLPRSPKQVLCSARLFQKSILQGMMIFIASFGIYYFMYFNGYSVKLARTSGFSVLVLSNIFLVFVNCSETEAVWHTMKKIRKDMGIWLVDFLILSCLFLMIYSPINSTLGFCAISLSNLLLVFGISLPAVLWYEIVKMSFRLRRRKKDY